VRHPLWLAAVLPCVFLFVAAPCSAVVEGRSEGDVAILYSDGFAFGYSTATQAWSVTPLVGEPIKHTVSPNLGLILTADRFYAFNPNAGQWYSTPSSGILQGLDIDGPVAVVWTDQACYAISTVWTLWARCDLGANESVAGGGSCCAFGMVWTSERALAYRANTNSWVQHELASPPLGGVAANGLGLVYSLTQAVVFKPSTGTWVDLGLDENMLGLSAAGYGDAALLWTESRALAYSGHSCTWTPLEALVFDGSAGGDVALVYNEHWAYGFDANLAQWKPIYIKLREGRAAEGNDGPALEPRCLVWPNPAPACADIELRLPADGGDAWEIDILDTAGRVVRRFSAPASKDGSVATWNATDDSGQALAAGVYWLRAASQTRTEARRVVLLP